MRNVWIVRALPLAMAISLIGCAHVRLPMPETCSPMPNEVVCPSKSHFFGPEKPNPFDLDAGGFVCFRPEEIEPFLERCGQR